MLSRMKRDGPFMMGHEQLPGSHTGHSFLSWLRTNGVNTNWAATKATSSAGLKKRYALACFV